jgi:putative ABC transport system substrate-binding protein
MRRRQFIAGLGAASLWPLPAGAQLRKIPQIGVLWHAGNEDDEAPFLRGLRQGFSEIGYVEGKDFVLDNRFAAERYEQFTALAAELVAANVDVLVAVSAPAARAVHQATMKIPVVFVAVADPVGFKFVESLAHPGGNMTGVSNVQTDLSGKQLEFFKDAVPWLSHVVLLGNPDLFSTRRYFDQYEAAATSLGFKVEEVLASRPDELTRAIAAIPTRTGLVILPDGMLHNERKHIADFALRQGLPLLGWSAEIADAGALISYGADNVTQFRRVAFYVDKILKGAKPADLPVEQPTQLKLVVNLKTAKALGLTIPPTLLTHADEVIE